LVRAKEKALQRGRSGFPKQIRPMSRRCRAGSKSRAVTRRRHDLTDQRRGSAMAETKRQPAPIRMPVLLARLQAHALGKGEQLSPSQMRAIEILIRECRLEGQGGSRSKEGENGEIPIRVERYFLEPPPRDA
jgi:hypothetical protein